MSLSSKAEGGGGLAPSSRSARSRDLFSIADIGRGGAAFEGAPVPVSSVGGDRTEGEKEGSEAGVGWQAPQTQRFGHRAAFWIALFVAIWAKWPFLVLRASYSVCKSSKTMKRKTNKKQKN